MNDAEIGKVLRREPDAWARAVQDHLAIKTATGPIAGCQCGQMRLGESYTEHLRAALPHDTAAAAPNASPESVAAAETPRWRAGDRVPEHLYRDEVPVATMPAHVVAEIVEAMTRRGLPSGPACARPTCDRPWDFEGVLVRTPEGPSYHGECWDDMVDGIRQ